MGSGSSTITVSDSASLQAAYYTLSQTSGGGTILIASNAAPFEISLTGGGNGFVTITSANAGNPSDIAGINLSNVTNVKIDNIDLNSNGSTREAWLKDINIAGSSNITISNSTMTSNASGFFSLSDPNAVLGEDLGLIRDSSGITFERNTVSGYNQGLEVRETTNVQILGNEFTELQSDGLRLSGVQDVLIQGNNFNNFFGSMASFNHDDMIQIWSTGATLLTRNVTIDGNVFNSGDGAGSQTIFIGNEQYAQGNMASIYTNIAITNNVIYNGHLHGITVAGANGVLVDSNIVAWDRDSVIVDDERTLGVISNVNYQPGINFYSVTNGTVSNNVSGIFNLSPGTTTSGNINQDGIAAFGQSYIFSLLNIAAGDLGSSANDVVKNSGTISGDLALADGADKYVGVGSGVVTGTVYGDKDPDVLIGGDGADRLSGGGDNDILRGRGGEDTLFGGSGDDVLRGGARSDILRGGVGNDNLFGDLGSDVLVGGAGGDQLFGGGGSDTFVFVSLDDSLADSKINRDTIMDFEKGVDKIDLQSLYSGQLDFIGKSGFSGTAMELRIATGTENSFVQVDSDGDGQVDFAIVVSGVTGLLESDFIL